MQIRLPASLIMAPQVGFEPTTLRLTAACSTAELLRNINDYVTYFIKYEIVCQHFLKKNSKLSKKIKESHPTL